MKREGMYRFCIQFGAGSEDEIRVGELLENLGRKKSTVIISALLEYLQNHPELESGGYNSRVQVSTITLSSLEAHITRLIEQKLAAMDFQSLPVAPASEQVREVSQDIVDMLGDLDLFNI